MRFEVSSFSVSSQLCAPYNLDNTLCTNYPEQQSYPVLPSSARVGKLEEDLTFPKLAEHCPIQPDTKKFCIGKSGTNWDRKMGLGKAALCIYEAWRENEHASNMIECFKVFHKEALLIIYYQSHPGTMTLPTHSFTYYPQVFTDISQTTFPGDPWL